MRTGVLLSSLIQRWIHAILYRILLNNLSSEKIKSHLPYQQPRESCHSFLELAKKRQTVFVEDVDKVPLSPGARKLLVDELSVKSYLVAQIYDDKDLFGTLVLHYVEIAT